MTTPIRIFILLGLFIFQGCQSKDSPSITPDQPVNPSPTPTAGTGHSGGGNSYHGKPLESYIQKPKSLAAYKNVVQRVVDAAIPDIQYPMTYMLEAKTWYFVPGPLTGLPSSQIGAVVSTDQAALQDFNQVWIDQDIFEKMSEADQGKLILHEILMGFKLLKFEAPRTSCFALRFNASPDFRSECQERSDKRIGSPSNLSVVDYADVRQMTDRLLTMDLATLDAPMKWRTIFNKGNFHFPGMHYASLDDSKDSSYEKNLTDAKRSLEIGYQPTYGYSIEDMKQLIPGWKRGDKIPDGTVWKSTSKCAVEIFASEKMFHFKVQVGDYKIEDSVRVSDSPNNTSLGSWTWDHNQRWIDGNLYWQRDLSPFIPLPKLPSAPGRDREERIIGYFDASNNLRAVILEEWYMRSPGSHWGAYDDEVLGGHYYVCALTPEIVFQKKSELRSKP